MFLLLECTWKSVLGNFHKCHYPAKATAIPSYTAYNNPPINQLIGYRHEQIPIQHPTLGIYPGDAGHLGRRLVYMNVGKYLSKR